MAKDADKVRANAGDVVEKAAVKRAKPKKVRRSAPQPAVKAVV